MKNRFLKNCILLGVVAAALAAIAFSFRGIEKHPLINEVCGNNFSVIMAENEKYMDYIELYNPTSHDVSMEEYYLSDDENQPKKFSLAGIVVPAHGYALVWADKDLLPEAGLANFGISKRGEKICLSDANGKIIDAVNMPALSYNVSYGRTENGGGHFAPMTPTPKESNLTAEILGVRQVKSPVFSVESGFYEEDFEVTIVAEPGLEVYYTLDGSDPTPESEKYRGPIPVSDVSSKPNVYAEEKVYVTYTPPEEPVDKATVLRAVAYDPLTRGFSTPTMATYFVDYAAKEIYDNLYVLSVTTDPSNLFDFEKGIYTMGRGYEEYKILGGFVGLPDEEIPSDFTDENGVVHYRYESTNAGGIGRKWEREVQAVLFDERHEIVFEKTLGMRIAGESTRSAEQKSFNLFARDIYDSGDGFMIPDLAGYRLKKIRLRRLADEIGFLEPFLHSLLKERVPSTQNSLPCVVFLDGEYWGIYNLKEAYDEPYFEGHYSVPEENLWVMKNMHAETGPEEEVMSAYSDFLYLVRNLDLRDAALYEMLGEYGDLKNLMEYSFAHVYLNHMDISLTHNQSAWRSAEARDGSFEDTCWRYLFYDLDFSCVDPAENTLQIYREQEENMYLPDYLSVNETFREEYATTIEDMMNTTFAYERVHALLMEWKEKYKDQVIATYHRFGNEAYDEEDYDKAIQKVDDFFRERPAYVKEFMD